MINLKRLAQESLSLLARHVGRVRLSARVSNLENRLQLTAIRERVCSCEHFYDEAAERPDVCFTGVGGLFDDFGGHPEDGALEGGAVDVAAVFGGLEEGGGFDAFGDAEVGDFDVALVVDEDVGAFDVAVDDVAAVQVGEPCEDLPDEVSNEGFVELAVGVEHGGDGAPGNVFEEDVEVFGIGVGAEILDYVFVLEIAEEVDLAFEGSNHAFFLFVEDAVAVGGNFDLFDCHEFASDGVESEINAAK